MCVMSFDTRKYEYEYITPVLFRHPNHQRLIRRQIKRRTRLWEFTKGLEVPGLVRVVLVNDVHLILLVVPHAQQHNVTLYKCRLRENYESISSSGTIKIILPALSPSSSSPPTDLYTHHNPLFD